ncbi:hypothetical protein [Rhizobacter sp. Root1221]|uniref:hypothetical protein n=1 Tax=Rhizobacter sp. Root1221 TaxID=1736433 RepID=UPI0006F938B5|nr:hypothetical protein [Rhizobacter sp. Root1221]KQW03080.1 hypothetical protein ASC87_01735 [Rhizobacter sp. Root1221]
MFRKRLDRIWNQLKDEHAGLFTEYKNVFGQKKNGPDLLQALLDATGKPCSQPSATDVPNVTRFVVQLDARLPAIHVLTWKEADGAIGDVRLAKSDSADALAQVLGVMIRSAKFRKSDRNARDESGNWREEGGQWRPVRQLWQKLEKLGEDEAFRSVLDVWRGQPGNELLPDFRVLEYLQALTNGPDARSVQIKSPSVQRFVLRVPGMKDTIDVLRRLTDDGSLAELRMVPAQKERLPWLINDVERGAVRSVARRTREEGTGPRTPANFWNPLKEHLNTQFEAFREDRRRKHERVPAAGAFVKHLDALCMDDDESEVVDAGNDIWKHEVTPDGSRKPIVLLRRTDTRGLASLRVLSEGMTLAAVQASMVSDLAKGQRKASAAAPTEPAPPIAPQPATSPPKLKDAHQLTQVLELAVLNRAQSKELLAGVAEVTGIPDRELRNWINYDGSLLRAASALINLRGYFDEREDLYGLFTLLGQPESAKTLPGELTAEQMVKVLQARLAHPGANTTRLAHMVNCNPEAVARHFADDHATFMKAGNYTLRALPDYLEHWAGLQAALKALGHVERAAGLPAPDNEAQRFLRELEERLYPVRIAVAQMRRDPTLLAADAAQLVNTWPEMPALLDKLVGPGGTLREAAAIARDLQAFSPDLQPLLENLLNRIDPQVRTGAMVEELMPAQGIMPGKVFIVREPPPDEAALAQGARPVKSRRIERIYANSADLVVAPRSYRAERQKQSLRWLSTVLKGTFSRAAEVQAYWDPKRGEIWVSSNDTTSNAAIEEFLSQGMLTRNLQAFSGNPHASRRARHTSNLRKMLNDESARPAQARELLDAMFNGRFRVPIEVYRSSTSGRRIELHAERRIKRAFEGQYGEGSLDRNRIAGTMRPCGICAKDFSLPDTARRGPFWMSRSSGEGYDVIAIAEENRNASIGAYATVTRQGELTIAYNTDSTDGDSEAAEEAPQETTSTPALSSWSVRKARTVLGKRDTSQTAAQADRPGEPTKPDSAPPPAKRR